MSEFRFTLNNSYEPGSLSLEVDGVALQSLPACTANSSGPCAIAAPSFPASGSQGLYALSLRWTAACNSSATFLGCNTDQTVFFDAPTMDFECTPLYVPPRSSGPSATHTGGRSPPSSTGTSLGPFAPPTCKSGAPLQIIGGGSGTVVVKTVGGAVSQQNGLDILVGGDPTLSINSQPFGAPQVINIPNGHYDTSFVVSADAARYPLHTTNPANLQLRAPGYRLTTVPVVVQRP